MKTLIEQIAAIAIVFLLACQPLFSQPQITGAILTADKQLLSYANVLLVSAAGSSLVKGEISAEDGGFAFKEIAANDHRIPLSMVGFKDSRTAELHL